MQSISSSKREGIFVRRILPGEAERLADVRLRALRDAPYAFGEALAEAEARTPEGWIEYAVKGSRGPDRATFLAFDEERICGLSGCYREEDLTDTAQIVSVWVDPGYRGLRLGERLVRAAAEWAHISGMTTIQLWVTTMNTPAIDLYIRMGFSLNPQRKSLASDASLTLALMSAESVAIARLPRPDSE